MFDLSDLCICMRDEQKIALELDAFSRSLKMTLFLLTILERRDVFLTIWRASVSSQALLFEPPPPRISGLFSGTAPEFLVARPQEPIYVRFLHRLWLLWILVSQKQLPRNCKTMNLFIVINSSLHK